MGSKGFSSASHRPSSRRQSVNDPEQTNLPELVSEQRAFLDGLLVALARLSDGWLSSSRGVPCLCRSSLLCVCVRVSVCTEKDMCVCAYRVALWQA